MDAPAVTVETHLPGGLPSFTLVGLPETAVREARDRVRSAIQNCGLDFPAGRVVVNLAPADLVKEGARFDLAIAISILCATGQVPSERVSAFEFLGELGLFGEIRRVRGALCALDGQFGKINCLPRGTIQSWRSIPFSPITSKNQVIW